jgi:hypothetical protein
MRSHHGDLSSARAFLRKPFTGHTLGEAIRDVLDA